MSEGQCRLHLGPVLERFDVKLEFMAAYVKNYGISMCVLLKGAVACKVLL